MDSRSKAGKLARAIAKLSRCARENAVKMRHKVQQKTRTATRNERAGWYPDLAR